MPLSRVAVIGAGAREHAIAAVLARDVEVLLVPGNPAMAGLSSEGKEIRCLAVDPEQLDALPEPIDLVVIGPEAPLVDGLADRLRARGLLVFGPGAAGAQLEGSKAFMKDLAHRAGVPTARYGVFTEQAEAEAFLDTLGPLYVIKTDGLAAGKGVLVTDDLEEARRDIAEKLSGDAFGAAGRRVIIEEGMVGPELSLLVLCADGHGVALPPAQDFKRIFDADAGPNTGGMGAYSPVPVATTAIVHEIMERIVHPTLRQLQAEGIDYRGVLYAGCMLTAEGPKLIEYNIRFGDPEAEVVLPRLTSNLAETLAEVARGGHINAPTVTPEATVCVVIAAEGYPGSVRSGDVITGLAEASTVKGVQLFHAGTSTGSDGSVTTAGGRVLCVSARGVDLAEARQRAYQAVGAISFAGMQFRSDIAQLAAATLREKEPQ